MRSHPYSAVAVFVALSTIGIDVRGSVNQCGPANQCLCIYWTTSAGGYLEERCPSDSGWTTQPVVPPIPGYGTWGGDGTATNPPTAPGSPLPAGELSYEVGSANSAAARKVHGDRVYDDLSGKYIYEPTPCTDLFYGSKFNEDGWSLLNYYISYRYGEGVRDSHGSVPCASGAAAWTECCNYQKYVFICDAFKNMSASTQQAILIHEAMHVAGQLEDGSSTSGPGDPPNTSEITSTVRAACGM